MVAVRVSQCLAALLVVGSVVLWSAESTKEQHSAHTNNWAVLVTYKAIHSA